MLEQVCAVRIKLIACVHKAVVQQEGLAGLLAIADLSLQQLHEAIVTACQPSNSSFTDEPSSNSPCMKSHAAHVRVCNAVQLLINISAQIVLPLRE